MSLPRGYVVISMAPDHLIAGVTDFMLMYEDAAPAIDYAGRRYTRGLLESIPLELAGQVCSMRRYDAVPESTTASPGETFITYAERLIRIAKVKQNTVEGEFNGTRFFVRPDSSAGDVCEIWELRRRLDRAERLQRAL